MIENNILDETFKKSNVYLEFKNEYSGTGWLKIRVYKASEAIPVEGAQINVYTLYKNEKIVFFEGTTNSSGTIDKISLPTPIIENNLMAPPKITYTIELLYGNTKESYNVSLYDGICVMQNINLKTIDNDIRRNNLWP